MLILYLPIYFMATNEGYLFTAIKRKHDRHPWLVKGDLSHHRPVISDSPHSQAKSCFVLTYDREVSDDLARQHIDEFEGILVPGLEGRYSSYWVRHAERGKHGSRTALHGEISTTELDSGHRLQPFYFPRDWSRVLLFQGVLNARHGFADPSLPEHGSWVRFTGRHKEVQQAMANQLLDHVHHSGDTDGDALDVLKLSLGYHVQRITPRHGRPFLRCVYGDQRVDLHGRIYAPNGLTDYLAATPEDRALSAASRDIRPDLARAQALQAQLDSYVARQRKANELTLTQWTQHSESVNPTTAPTLPALPSHGPSREQFTELLTRALLQTASRQSPPPTNKHSPLQHEEETQYSRTDPDRPVGDERTPPGSSPGIRGGATRLGLPYHRARHSLRAASQAVERALDCCGRARDAIHPALAGCADLDRAMHGLSGALDTAQRGMRDLSLAADAAIGRLDEALARWAQIQQRVTPTVDPSVPDTLMAGNFKADLLTRLTQAAERAESLDRKTSPEI